MNQRINYIKFVTQLIKSDLIIIKSLLISLMNWVRFKLPTKDKR